MNLETVPAVLVASLSPVIEVVLATASEIFASTFPVRLYEGINPDIPSRRSLRL